MIKISLIIQARFGSSRLPGKILKKINDKELLLIMYERLKKCKNINEIVVCTSVNNEDNVVNNFCLKNDIKCFRGSEENVLERFYQTSNILNSDIIIRCTGDCPLIDNLIIDKMIEEFIKNDYKYYVPEYLLNSSFPDGFACEIFKFEVLKEAYLNATSMYDKEHVTPYIVRKYEDKNNFFLLNDKSISEIQQIYKNLDFSILHLSVDTEKDFDLISKIINNFDDNNFTCFEVLEYLNNNSNIINNIEHKINNLNGKGQELYNEAKKIIPGGTQLLSKRPEMFLPEHWPSYYNRTNGIEVITLDGVKMKDFSHMSVGSCILGYRDPDVNDEVHQSIDRGNMCTLNSPKEVELTKLLCDIHPWAKMARYCKSGGEACSMAIRIARAYTKKDKIAFCGYHGWCDWYLAANWNNGNELNNHLIKGLNPNGVPYNLRNTVFPFNYNKFDELENILENHDIGTIIMETQRGESPKDNFLHKIRNICDKKNIILIFDEVSSGFRLNSGGLHLLYNINPDIAVFAKGMSNGYPLGAVIGKKEIMSIAEDTFISSTNWTDDIGFSAAIATIKKHIKYNVGEHINTIGKYYQESLIKISKEIGINIKVSGMPCFSAFSFDYDNYQEIKTLYVQMMLERNIMAKDTLYVSFAHKKEDIDYYLDNIKDVFTNLKVLIDNNEVLMKLSGPVAHSGFQRLVS